MRLPSGSDKARLSCAAAPTLGREGSGRSAGRRNADVPCLQNSRPAPALLALTPAHPWSGHAESSVHLDMRGLPPGSAVCHRHRPWHGTLKTWAELAERHMQECRRRTNRLLLGYSVEHSHYAGRYYEPHNSIRTSTPGRAPNRRFQHMRVILAGVIIGQSAAERGS